MRLKEGRNISGEWEFFRNSSVYARVSETMSGKIFLVVINALALCYALPPPLPSAASSAMTCEFFDKSSCTSSLGCNVTTQVCPLADLDKRTHCYAFWTYDSMGHVSVEMKGCWLDNFLCYNQPRCVSSEQVEESGSVKYYCCCEGNMCNTEVYLANAPDILPPVHHTQPAGRGAIVSSRPHDSNIVMETILYTLVPLTVFAVCIVSAFWIWRRFCSFNRMNQLPPDDPSLSPLAAEPCPDTSSYSQLKLVEIKAHGRFGSLWKGVTSTGHPVAVKVFPLHDQQSWSAERDFYNLLNVCSHANMLKFIGSHNRGNELWLVTEYHEHGSLYDYLKGNTVTIAETVNMSLTMCRGLAFLHSATNNKPMVAHRDFKSRNVLLRRDFSVCIADFGLALVLDFHPGNVHGQVGTRRYMSPEILDCSINFTVEHFLKIDVYACALVLWEILSRCVLPGVSPGDYQMPFEEEIGIHPSLEDLQDLVVTKRSRPSLKESWYTNEITAKLCTAVEECWDHDPEARLSAECVEERLLNIQEALLLSLTDSSELLADSTSLSEP